MPRVDLHKSAVRFLDRLPPKQKRQVAVRIANLARDPAPQDAKLLKGFEHPFRRADMGEYRIVYLVLDDVLHVLVVGKRNDYEVYRQLRRRF